MRAETEIINGTGITATCTFNVTLNHYHILFAMNGIRQWFTFLHELGHIKLDDKTGYIMTNETETVQEKRNRMYTVKEAIENAIKDCCVNYELIKYPKVLELFLEAFPPDKVISIKPLKYWSLELAQCILFYLTLKFVYPLSIRNKYSNIIKLNLKNIKSFLKQRTNYWKVSISPKFEEVLDLFPDIMDTSDYTELQFFIDSVVSEVS